MKDLLRFYVYAYLRTDNTPYYIGKGSYDRKVRKHYNRNRGATVPKNRSQIVIIFDNLTEFGAFALERKLIRWYGRKDTNAGILRNLTDGGEGTSGRIVTESQRLKISETKKGLRHSEETKQKMKISAKTRPPQSELTRLKRVKSLSGPNNHAYDHVSYTFSHPLFGMFAGTRHELSREFKFQNISTGNLNLIIKHPHKVCKGWSCINSSTPLHL